MKKLFSFLIFAAFSTSLLAQFTWKADPMHSKLTFSTIHMGISEVTGLFKTFDVTATAEKPDFSDAVFDLTANVASVNTEAELRDNHLRSAEFFNAATFDKMTFTSTSIKKAGKDKYTLTGNLTLHGITKPVTMNLWYRGTIVNPMTKATTAGFQLTGALNRPDFNIGAKYPPPIVSNEVKIKADGEFIKQ